MGGYIVRMLAGVNGVSGVVGVVVGESIRDDSLAAGLEQTNSLCLVESALSAVKVRDVDPVVTPGVGRSNAAPPSSNTFFDANIDMTEEYKACARFFVNWTPSEIEAASRLCSQPRSSMPPRVRAAGYGRFAIFREIASMDEQSRRAFVEALAGVRDPNPAMPYPIRSRRRPAGQVPAGFVDYGRGAAVDVKVLATADKLVLACINHFTCAEIAPLWEIARHFTGGAFEAYYHSLIAPLKKYRVRGVLDRLWRFFRHDEQFARLILSDWPGRNQALAHGRNYGAAYEFLLKEFAVLENTSELLAHVALMDEILGCPSRVVDLQSEFPVLDVTDPVDVCQVQGGPWAKDHTHQNPFADGIAVDEVQGKRPPLGNPYAQPRDRFDLRPHPKVVANEAWRNVKGYAALFAARMVDFANIISFFNSRNYVMLAANLLKLFGTPGDFGLLEVAREFYNSWATFREHQLWEKEAKDFAEALASGEDLEAEPEPSELDPDGVLRSAVDTVQGPDGLPLFTESTLWRKMLAVIFAASAPDIIRTMPGFLQLAIQYFSETTMSISSGTNLVGAILGFCSSFYERALAAIEKKDWRELLVSGGWDTWLARAHEMQGASLKAGGRWVSATTIISELEGLVKEADEVLRRDAARSALHKRFTPAHNVLYSRVIALLRDWKGRNQAAKQRPRAPFTLGLFGPPGVGKTVYLSELTEFCVSKLPERRVPGRGVEVVPGDLYMVNTQDKYWNNCRKPVVLVFNDITGDGHGYHKANLADSLRLAAETETFATPQAAIEDKADNTIDPNVVVFTSNDMTFDFSCWGTSWSKLIRRYRNLFYVAYPERYYARDISPTGADHGLLKPEFRDAEYTPAIAKEMRYFKVVMGHHAGKLMFRRAGQVMFAESETSSVAANKLTFALHIKKLYEKYDKEKPFLTLDGHKCSACTRYDEHPDGRCIESCDWTPAKRRAWEEDEEEKQAPPPVVGAVQGGALSCVKAKASEVVDSIADSQADRIVRAHIAAFRARVDRCIAMLREHSAEIAVAAVSTVLAASVIASVVIGARGRESRKPRPVAAVEGNVLNPVAPTTPLEHIVRYGIAEAPSREMPNPPKYPSNVRTHCFTSDASRTSTFEDVRRLVNGNTYTFTSGSRRGVGVFMDSTTILFNKHVLDGLGGEQIVIDHGGVNGPKCFFFAVDVVADPSRDLALVRVPSFPAAPIWKHVIASGGSVTSGSPGCGPVVAVRQARVDFEGKLGLSVVDVWSYPGEFKAGDCGLPLVLDVNGKGILAGVHVASLKVGGLYAAMPLGPFLSEMASRLPPAPGQVVARKFLDKVDQLHSSSKLRAAESVSMMVLGSAGPSHQSNPRSRILETPLHPVAIAQMRELRVIPDLHIDGVRVDGKWFAPYIHKFAGLSFEPTAMDPRPLRAAVADYLAGLPTRGGISPIPLAQALAGVAGDPLLKHVNLKTSAGVFNKLYGGKDKILAYDEIHADIRRGVLEYVSLAETYVLVEHQKWALKDEVVTALKQAIKKYRYFMVSDVISLLVFRMFVAPLVAAMYADKEFFECHGAFNPASPEFGKLYDRLRAHANLLLADISHMDSSHRATMAEAVAEVFVGFARRVGYNEPACSVVRNMVVAVVFSLAEVNNDFAFLNEGMGSGVYITFIFNCVVLSLLYRVAWFRLSAQPFRASNVLVTGGDDSALSTSLSSFTGRHIQAVFRDYGYKLSPPTNKEAEMVDFNSWDEFVFLKRSPSIVPYCGRSITVGALDTDSIWKAVAFSSSDVAVSQEDRLAQVLDGAQREMALHGPVAFGRFHALVGPSYAFRRLTYDEVIDRYVASKLYDDVGDLFPPMMTVDEVQGFVPDATPLPGLLALCRWAFWAVWVHLCCLAVFPRGVMVGLFPERAGGRQGLRFLVLASLLLWSRVCGFPLEAKPPLATDHSAADDFLAAREAVLPATWGTSQDKEVFTSTPSWSQVGQASWYSNQPHYKAQIYTSITIGNDTRISSQSGTATFQLATGHAPAPSQTTYPPLFAAPTKLASIQEALSRPVHIGTFDWTTSAVGAELDLYSAWRLNSFVASKLYGYKFFRGRPVLRLVVNGNVMYYGKLVLAVDINPGDDGFTADSCDPQLNSVIMQHVSQALQTWHVAINPSQSQTYDLSFPWYSATGWYNLISTELAPVATLRPFIQNPLRTVAETPAGVTVVQVYLMMHDVELSVPCVIDEVAAARMDVAPEDRRVFSVEEVQGDVPPEAKPAGTLSAVATATANAMGAFSSVPSLGRYVGPLSSGLGAFGTFLRSIGYAAPIIIEESRPTVNLHSGSLTYHNARQPISKLTGDVRQEVAISAAAASLGDDGDMLLSRFVTRPGLARRLVWTTGGVTPADFSVNPAMTCTVDTIAGVTFHTPLGYVARHFQRYTGSIVLRFEVVASAFHRGALAFSFVPHDEIVGVAELDMPNYFQTEIVDISETKVVEMTLPYADDRVFANITSGGYVKVTVVTPLKSQGSSPAVDVNIYVYAGPDFELAEFLLNTTATPIPVAMVQGEGGDDEATDQHVGQSPPLNYLGKPSIMALCYGERYVSLKQLVSRHTLARSWVPTGTTSGLNITYLQHPLPCPIPDVGGDATFNVVTLHGLFAPCFLAQRGGFRYKMDPQLAASTTQAETFVYSAALVTPVASPNMAPSHVLLYDNASTSKLRRAAARESQGTVIGDLRHHPLLEWEAPDVCRTNFRNARKMQNDVYLQGGRRVTELQFPAFTLLTPPRVDIYMGVADDYSLHGFAFLPGLYTLP